MKSVQVRSYIGRFSGLFWALALSNAVSVGLFMARAIDAGNFRYWFLVWNLFLAWLPVAVAAWLVLRLKESSWISWPNLVLTFLWLGFLPNSFYILTDFIHLDATGEVGLLYDIVLLSSFAFNGLVAGFISLFFLHRELMKRVRLRDAHTVIGVTLFMSSFAIYLGRFMRWNTWDVLVNPAGILFDVSDYVINPAAKPQVFVTTVTFFVLLGAMYIVIYQFVKALSNSKNS